MSQIITLPTFSLTCSFGSAETTGALCGDCVGILRAIVCVLSAHLRDDESSTCVCLRLREQCLRSEITSVSRVANVLLLRLVAGNVGVNTPASKRS